jgi:YHS domain-containing protein
MVGSKKMPAIPKQPATVLAETACGGRLKDPSGYPQAVYKGNTIYFCNKACLQAFLGNPHDFMAGKIEHPLD